MSDLIINEPHLMVSPTIAYLIGLNESIVLQRIHYWINLNLNKNLKDEQYWVYNSYDNWKKQFFFWSDSTLRRTFRNLEKMDILNSMEPKKHLGDRTKWYTINYKKLQEMIDSIPPSGQIDQMPLN